MPHALVNQESMEDYSPIEINKKSNINSKNIIINSAKF